LKRPCTFIVSLEEEEEEEEALFLTISYDMLTFFGGWPKP